MADMKARTERADIRLERQEAIKVDALCTCSMFGTNVKARPCVTLLGTVRKSSLRNECLISNILPDPVHICENSFFPNTLIMLSCQRQRPRVSMLQPSVHQS